MSKDMTCQPKKNDKVAVPNKVESSRMTADDERGLELEDSVLPSASIVRRTDAHIGSIPFRLDPYHYQMFSPDRNPYTNDRYAMDYAPSYPLLPTVFNADEYRSPAAHAISLMARYNPLALNTYDGCSAVHAIRNVAGQPVIPGPHPGLFLPPRGKFTGQKGFAEFSCYCPGITTSECTTEIDAALPSFGNNLPVQTSPNRSQRPLLVSNDVPAPSSEYMKKRKADDVSFSNHFTFEGGIPLSTEEDENWLSPSHHFFRLRCVELFCATRDDIIGRKHNKEVHVGQAGIRCVFCSTLRYKERTPRSFSFPSSTTRIYQSVTVMLHYHFGSCPCVPDEVKNTFNSLKGKARQGANNAKKFWIKSATDLGLADTQRGMFFQKNYAVRNKKPRVDPFVRDQQRQQKREGEENVLLCEDRELVSDYVFEIMKQVKIIHLTPAEQIGSRCRLNVGHPGLGCRHCVHRGGLGRVFPTSSKKLEGKINIIHDHLMRCSLCPPSVKEHIKNLGLSSTEEDPVSMINKEKFYRIIWSRMNDVDALHRDQDIKG